MSDLVDAILGLNNVSGIENSVESNLNSVFLNNKNAWVSDIVTGYTKYGKDPNESISKVATEYKLNEQQIQRLVEESNIGIYLDKYAATKGAKVRRVEFDLADPQKVGGYMNKAAESNNMFAPSLEKAASEDNGSYLNAFNSESNYEPAIWEKDSMNKSASTMIKRKLGNRLAEEKLAETTRLKGILSKIAFVADALVYNERAGGSAQYLLNKIASEVNDDRVTNAIIKSAMNKVTLDKEAKYLPGNFDMSLEVQDVPVSEYSLGKHSLLNKVAADKYVVKMNNLPDRVTYEKLVQIAKEIKQELDNNDSKGPIEVKVVR